MSADGVGKGSGGNDSKNEDTDRFADLVGETKPLAQRPAQVGKIAHRAKVRSAPETHAPTRAFRRPDPDEPRLAAAPGVSDALLLALRRGEPEFEEKIDLHGLRRNAAARALARFVKSAHARGLRCVLVVHGKGRGSETGEAVLREAVPGWLSKSPNAEYVLGFAPAPDRLGGEGAMLVRLRKG